MQEHLLKICIDSPNKDEYGDDASYVEDAYAPDKALDADDHHRRLLASSGGNPCSEGKVRHMKAKQRPHTCALQL